MDHIAKTLLKNKTSERSVNRDQLTGTGCFKASYNCLFVVA